MAAAEHMRATARRAAAALAALFLAAGCATTTIETSGTTLAQPLCRPGGTSVPVALYWRTQWRPDQKEPAAREALARRGIGHFAAGAGCLAVVVAEELPAAAGVPTDAVLLERARRDAPAAARIVHLAIGELGPRLVIGGPTVVEGGTEVAIDTRVIDAATGARLADGHTRWRNGGALVIKGVGGLDHDLAEALRAVLLEGAPAR